MALGYYPNVSIEPSAQVFVPQRAAGWSTRAMAGHVASFIRSHRRLMVLTGAGCSTASGIPDYRDRDGAWKHPRPVQYQDFVTEPAVRQRYWARSVAGWQRIAAARPNQAHLALARLETRGAVHHLITQNVDGLHQRAGSERVIDLHGRLASVRCIQCSTDFPRKRFQTELGRLNPAWPVDGRPAPDGDVHLDHVDYRQFAVPDCSSCGGILKPDVVFFGESVPRQRVKRALACLAEADALLVIGSSLMVFSGFRFAREAARRQIPVAAVNQGRTRADELLTLKIDGDCTQVLAGAVNMTDNEGQEP